MHGLKMAAMLILLLLLAGIWLASAPNRAAAAASVPPFELADLSGQSWTLDGLLDGKSCLVLCFWIYG